MKIYIVLFCVILNSTSALGQVIIPDSILKWPDQKLTFEAFKNSAISSNNFEMVLLARGKGCVHQTNDSTFVRIFGDSTTFVWRDFKQTTQHAALQMDQGDYFLFCIEYFGGGSTSKEGFIYKIDAVDGDWVYVTQKVRVRKRKLIEKQKLLFKLVRD